MYETVAYCLPLCIVTLRIHGFSISLKCIRIVVVILPFGNLVNICIERIMSPTSHGKVQRWEESACYVNRNLYWISHPFDNNTLDAVCN